MSGIPHRTSPTGYKVFVIPCRKKSRQHSQSVLHHALFYPPKQHKPFAPASVPGSHAVMPFALAASFLTAATCVLQTYFVQSSSITLHYASFVPNAHVRFVWVIGKHTCNAYNHKLHSLPAYTPYAAFRFIPSSSLSKFAVHPLPLLCSPALSFGLRAVMLFVSRLVG